ncbi:MAG: hypothetical protein H6R26_3509, partial [Proteobacteria bacterium]|nr:hypothetical protein [Pseudomonadota bacterium]
LRIVGLHDGVHQPEKVGCRDGHARPAGLSLGRRFLLLDVVQRLEGIRMQVDPAAPGFEVCFPFFSRL